PRLINREDAKVSKAVRKQGKNMARAVSVIVGALRRGNRLFFIGAGTSGRLGIMEAAECPPTFNTPPSLVQAFMAGGRSSVFRSKEGAEDRGFEAAQLIRKHVHNNDVVVGIAASGVTPFVKEGLKAARKIKAKTILVTCNAKSSNGVAGVVIAPKTGPEIIAGSTRLKAATATKMILNALTVASMIQLGKVYGNWMVDLQPRSKKLKARAIHLIQRLGHVSGKMAERLLRDSGGNAKTAILMARKNLTRTQAVSQLKKAQGRLHLALSL
ncbi:MAG: N-acetylmuramic acid 6-phosphate etherase, partial [Elusimicrobia bacterium]|nr:N-acetylmuramic acid 6-phosphate etherase [Candidatus Obscuribacterium magneticum]